MSTSAPTPQPAIVQAKRRGTPLSAAERRERWGAVLPMILSLMVIGSFAVLASADLRLDVVQHPPADRGPRPDVLDREVGDGHGHDAASGSSVPTGATPEPTAFSAQRVHRQRHLHPNRQLLRVRPRPIRRHHDRGESGQRLVHRLRCRLRDEADQRRRVRQRGVLRRQESYRHRPDRPGAAVPVHAPPVLRWLATTTRMVRRATRSSPVDCDDATLMASMQFPDPGTWTSSCVAQPWWELPVTSTPPPPPTTTRRFRRLPTYLRPSAPQATIGSCNVYFPGRYGGLTLGAGNHYFPSGVYYFDDTLTSRPRRSSRRRRRPLGRVHFRRRSGVRQRRTAESTRSPERAQPSSSAMTPPISADEASFRINRRVSDPEHPWDRDHRHPVGQLRPTPGRLDRRDARRHRVSSPTCTTRRTRLVTLR